MKRLLTVALLGLFLASTTIGCGGDKKDTKKPDKTTPAKPDGGDKE